MALLAEDALLLFLDDASGRATGDRSALNCALAGALLADLELAGRIRLSGAGDPVKPGRVVAVDSSATGDDVLDSALARVSRGSPAKPERLVPQLAKKLRIGLLGRLVDQGVVRREEHQLLGVFRVDRWPVVDGRRKVELRAQLQAVLVVGVSPDARTRALICVLTGAGQAYRLVERDQRKAAKETAKQLAADSWIAAAVRRAVQNEQATSAS